MAAAPAHAGTYDVVSCGAPGAGGVNRAWQPAGDFDDRFFDLAPACPELSAWSERRAGVVAPNFTGAGFQLTAPSGAILDRMVIWRTGYRFKSTDTAQGPWVVQGYKADASVIGGPFDRRDLRHRAGTVVLPLRRRGRDGCGRAGRTRPRNHARALFGGLLRPAGLPSANAEGFPFAGLSISGSVVTVRDEGKPAVVARGTLLASGWRTDDQPLRFGASDPVGIRRVRVLVEGTEALGVSPSCDFRAMAPCGQVSERSAQLGDRLPDGLDAQRRGDRHRRQRDARRPRRGDRPPRAGARVRPLLQSSPDRRRGKRHAGSGVTGGTIEARGRRGREFRALPTRLRWRPPRCPAGAGLAPVDHAPCHRERCGRPHVHRHRRAGCACRRDRCWCASQRFGLRARPIVRGSLRSGDGRPLPGREIIVRQRARLDRAKFRQVATRANRSSRRVPHPPPAGGEPGAARHVAGHRRSAGRACAGCVRGCRGRRRCTRSRAPLPRGGNVRLSGRLRLGAATLPPSGKLVELQAFDRGRWRVFADRPRPRGPRRVDRSATALAHGPGATGSASASGATAPCRTSSATRGLCA